MGQKMEMLRDNQYMQGAGLIIAMCAVVLVIVLFRRRVQLVFDLLLRLVCGITAIYVVNLLLARAGSGAMIGIGPTTVLVSTILGFPGLALLYGIKIVSTL